MKTLRSKLTAENSKGFTLIEALVVMFIFALIAVVFSQIYTVGTRLIIESKNRLGATALANQKMEIIRSIAYDKIGTKRWNGSIWVYGIPAGDLLEDETISVNTMKYTVHTFVQYVDDAFDGKLGGAPNDTIPTDYKRVRVTVSWGNLGVDQTVALFGNFSPNGIESSGGGGVLSVNIIGVDGSGVVGVNVHAVNSASGVDFTATTDATGNITLPGAPAGTEKYVLTASKNGYFGATTYPSYPTSSYNPVDVHASVVINTLNQKTLVVDRAVEVKLATHDPFGTAIPNVSFALTGGRVLGTDPATGELVYGFSSTSSTNGSGEKVYPNESYGQYTFTQLASGYEFYKMSPETSVVANVFDLLPGSTSQVTAILLDKNIGSVKVEVTNSTDGSPVNGASVKLSSVINAYDATVVTGQYGWAYFPTALPALVAGDYDITVTTVGFQNKTSTVTIGTTLTTKGIALTPN